jgi:hypothetical protein
VTMCAVEDDVSGAGYGRRCSSANDWQKLTWCGVVWCAGKAWSWRGIRIGDAGAGVANSRSAVSPGVGCRRIRQNRVESASKEGAIGRRRDRERAVEEAVRCPVGGEGYGGLGPSCLKWKGSACPVRKRVLTRTYVSHVTCTLNPAAPRGSRRVRGEREGEGEA